MYVSAVSSPSRFWVQFVGPQVTQLDSLVEEMTEYYGKKENRESHAVSIIVNDFSTVCQKSVVFRSGIDYQKFRLISGPL